MPKAVHIWLSLTLLTACAGRSQPEPPVPSSSMVVVPAGWFLMGQDEGSPSNQPQRQVYLDAFAIDRTEVTNAAFSQVLLETDYQALGRVNFT